MIHLITGQLFSTKLAITTSILISLVVSSSRSSLDSKFPHKGHYLLKHLSNLVMNESHTLVCLSRLTNVPQLSDSSTFSKRQGLIQTTIVSALIKSFLRIVVCIIYKLKYSLINLLNSSKLLTTSSKIKN